MKKYIIILIGFLLNSIILIGQSNCEDLKCNSTNNINITTGLDNTGNLLPYAVPDNNWRLINNPPLVNCTNNNLLNSINPPNAYTMNYANNNTPVWTAGPSDWANQPFSRTLAPGNIYALTGGSATIGAFNCNNGTNQNNEPQPFIFERNFCICKGGQITINLSAKADDIGIIKLINNQTNTVITQSGGIGQPTTTNWTTTNLLSPGNYSLRFELANTGATTTGFSVVGNITSSNSILIDGNSQCCNNYSLAIQKVFDVDCDGTMSNGDYIGNAGWVYDVFNTGTLVTTVTTNAFGEAILSGLSAGTYTIIEQQNSLYAYTNLSSNVTVAIGIGNPNGIAYFYNCISKLKIRKVLDNDCDETLSSGDNFGNNWTFNVFNGSSFVTSVVTGNNGSATIWGLPMGSYTIVEQANNASPNTIPLNNNINVSINQNNMDNSVTFYNCEPKLRIRKILDDNCDGIFEGSDQIGGSGWTFDIYNGSTIIDTAITNSSGIATFDSLLTGTYTIVERLNTGNAYPSPFQNNISITYDDTTFQTLDFFNCPPQPFPDCCENPFQFKKVKEGQLVNAPNGFNGSDPLSVVTDEFELDTNSVIPITEFRAVVTDIDFNYNFEACATCIDNPALWGSIGGSLYIGDKLTNTDQGANILDDRINRREIIWENKKGAMLEKGDTFKIDYAFPQLSEIPCCVTSVKICLEISYKDANCKVCKFLVCRTIDLISSSKEVGSLEIDVKKKVAVNVP